MISSIPLFSKQMLCLKIPDPFEASYSIYDEKSQGIKVRRIISSLNNCFPLSCREEDKGYEKKKKEGKGWSIH